MTAHPIRGHRSRFAPAPAHERRWKSAHISRLCLLSRGQVCHPKDEDLPFSKASDHRSINQQRCVGFTCPALPRSPC